MKISITLDLEPHESILVERDASIWLQEALGARCSFYECPASIHPDGKGLDLLPENIDLSSLGGFMQEIMDLEQDFLSGRPYRQIIQQLDQPSYMEW